MNRHRAVRLEDVAEINPRVPRHIADDDNVAFVPMSAVSEDGSLGEHGTRPYSEVKKGYTYFERGDVLVAKITPCFENGKAALVDNLVEPIGFGSTEFHVLRPGPDLDGRYLFYMLWNEKFRVVAAGGMTGSAGQKRVPGELLRRTETRLPPLEEQRRIAAILDKADALRQKRKRAIALLDRLTQAIFTEMFGGWTAPSVSLGEVAVISSGSTPPRSDGDNFGGDLPWVKTTEVKGGTIFETEESVSAQGIKAARLRSFPPGTILMAMYGQGTTRGNVAILGVPAAINQACAAIVLADNVNAKFVFTQLKMKYDEIRSLGRGGNQPNLNLALVGNIEILVPPLQQQLDFVLKLGVVERMVAAQHHQAGAMGLQFASLQHRAFSGQL